jgi:phage N-6-adenine-methyltransferase
MAGQKTLDSVSVIRRRRKQEVPTLSQMIREGREDADKIKRHTKEALLLWFRQSERLNIARANYALRGYQFEDFAGRIGVDKSSAYQLIKLWKHRAAILARCGDEGHYYGWETCLYWFERPPRHWPPQTPNRQDTDERGTPPAIFERFGRSCTLDVAASPTTTKCERFFTKRDDGLKKPWFGIVWLNPPYSDPAPWCKKAVVYARSGGRVIALLPAWTDAPWFHDYVSLGRITFLQRRVAFVGAGGSAPFPCMIVEWSSKTMRRRAKMLYAFLDDR